MVMGGYASLGLETGVYDCECVDMVGCECNIVVDWGVKVGLSGYDSV